MDEVAKLLLRQEKLATRAQLLDAGITKARLRWRLERGSWRTVLPTVVATFSGELTRRQQLIAASLYGGAHTQIAGLTALELHGLKYVPRDKRVHLLLPHGRSRLPSPKVRIIRTTRLDAGAWANGILRVCTPARAIVDGLRGNLDRRVVRAVVAEAVQGSHATCAEIARELEHSVRNGTAVLRKILAEVADGVRSAPEGELRALTKRSRILPEIRWNPTLRDAEGRRLPTPDGYIEDAGIALEVDSREFHLSADGWEATMQHHNRLAAAGILVLHFTPQQIRSEPHRVLVEIEQAYLKRLQDRGVARAVIAARATPRS
ncbi:MAG: hypothetical protein HOV79_23045 [Hamadaea sp.]|nr:hypothetical protein [Hamadaea sp.]